MVLSLKTDKIPSQTTKQSNQVGPRNGDVGPRNRHTEPDAREPASADSVEVSSAGRFYSEAADKTGETSGLITSQEQATKLTALIRQQFEQGGQQALKAQAAIQTDHAAALLEVSGRL